MLLTYDDNGRDLLLNPSEIVSVQQASPSDLWRGVKSYIRLSNGRGFYCMESVAEIAKKIDQQDGKGAGR